MIHQYFEESKSKWLKILIGIGIAFILCFIINISLGSVLIPIKDVFLFISGSETTSESWDLILANFRMPKALTAIFVGSALGVSGLQMQTLFRNPSFTHLTLSI